MTTNREYKMLAGSNTNIERQLNELYQTALKRGQSIEVLKMTQNEGWLNVLVQIDKQL